VGRAAARGAGPRPAPPTPTTLISTRQPTRSIPATPAPQATASAPRTCHRDRRVPAPNAPCRLARVHRGRAGRRATPAASLAWGPARTTPRPWVPVPGSVRAAAGRDRRARVARVPRRGTTFISRTNRGLRPVAVPLPRVDRAQAGSPVRRPAALVQAAPRRDRPSVVLGARAGQTPGTGKELTPGPIPAMTRTPPARAEGSGQSRAGQAPRAAASMALPVGETGAALTSTGLTSTDPRGTGRTSTAGTSTVPGSTSPASTSPSAALSNTGPASGVLNTTALASAGLGLTDLSGIDLASAGPGPTDLSSITPASTALSSTGRTSMARTSTVPGGATPASTGPASPVPSSTVLSSTVLNRAPDGTALTGTGLTRMVRDSTGLTNTDLSGTTPMNTAPTSAAVASTAPGSTGQGSTGQGSTGQGRRSLRGRRRSGKGRSPRTRSPRESRARTSSRLENQARSRTDPGCGAMARLGSRIPARVPMCPAGTRTDPARTNSDQGIRDRMGPVTREPATARRSRAGPEDHPGQWGRAVLGSLARVLVSMAPDTPVAGRTVQDSPDLAGTAPERAGRAVGRPRRPRGSPSQAPGRAVSATRRAAGSSPPPARPGRGIGRAGT
jgi:hypothetical protein